MGSNTHYVNELKAKEHTFCQNQPQLNHGWCKIATENKSANSGISQAGATCIQSFPPSGMLNNGGVEFWIHLCSSGISHHNIQRKQAQVSVTWTCKTDRHDLPREPAMKPRMRAFSGLVTLFDVLNISWASIICSFYIRKHINILVTIYLISLSYHTKHFCAL